MLIVPKCNNAVIHSLLRLGMIDADRTQMLHWVTIPLLRLGTTDADRTQTSRLSDKQYI